MKHRNFRIFTLLLVTLQPLPLGAQEGAAPTPEAPYVSVSVEVRGLAEPAAQINDAMRQLSATLAEIAASPGELTPEQIEVMTGLMREARALVEALERAMQELAPAVRSVEAPTREVLTGLIDTTRTQAIEPTIESIDRRVRTWLVLTLLGGLLVVGLAGFGLWLATRQLRAMVGVLRSLGDEYQIVPRNAVPAAAPAAEAPPGTGDAPPTDG